MIFVVIWLLQVLSFMLKVFFAGFLSEEQILHLDIRRNFFTAGVVRHRNGLLREGLESPSLEALKEGLDVTHNALVCN